MRRVVDNGDHIVVLLGVVNENRRKAVAHFMTNCHRHRQGGRSVDDADSAGFDVGKCCDGVAALRSVRRLRAETDFNENTVLTICDVHIESCHLFLLPLLGIKSKSSPHMAMWKGRNCKKEHLANEPNHLQGATPTVFQMA